MRSPLSLQEKITLLSQFYRREHRLPGYAEMLTLFDYRSRNAVFKLLRRMERAGVVRIGANGKLSATDRLSGAIRLLGQVKAGFPSPAEEELADTISLDEYLISHPAATFMLTVSGDSMLDAGIHPGDLVLVEKGREARHNDVVLAQVDGEWTLKYYICDAHGVRLEAANRRYPPIRPRQSLQIGGVVRAVIRKYR